MVLTERFGVTVNFSTASGKSICLMSVVNHIKNPKQTTQWEN